MTASTCARSSWNNSRSASLPIGPDRPPTVTRPSAVETMLSTTYGRSARGSASSRRADAAARASTWPRSGRSRSKFTPAAYWRVAPARWDFCAYTGLQVQIRGVPGRLHVGAHKLRPPAPMTPRQLIEPARLAGNALLHTQSDARLVDLARAGNDRAFEVIVARYRGPLLRYCERILPPGRAEDAVQQAFLNAYRAISRNEAELNLKPWLYRVAHNAALNLLRQNGWNYDEIPEDFDGVVQPPQALELRERLQELMRAVQELPERQRDALVLRELEGRSYEEISAALGVTGGAVRQLLNRARGTLRTAATALTPPRLLESLVERASSPVTGQIAEISAGAGGAAGILKIGAALLVAGAVGGAVVAGPAHHLVLGGSGHSGGAAEAAAAGAGGGGGSGGGGSGGGDSSLGGASATGIGIGPALGHGEAAPGGFGSRRPNPRTPRTRGGG